MRSFESGKFHENIAMFQPEEAGKDVKQPMYKPASPPGDTFNLSQASLLPRCPALG